MQNFLRKKDKRKEGTLDNENLREGLDKQGESEIVEPEYIPVEEKVAVYLRHEVYIDMKDAVALRRAFEKFASQWD